MDSTPLSLLERIADGADRAAWAEFDAIYRPLIRRYAGSCGISPEDSADIEQHVMVQVYRHIARFEHDARSGRFRGWLRVVVNRRVISMLNGRRGRNLSEGAADQICTREAPPDASFDRIWWNEHLRYYLQCIRLQVEERTFAAFEQHVLEQTPAATVCAKLGLSPNALYKIKWRITRMLRERMRGLIDLDT